MASEMAAAKRATRRLPAARSVWRARWLSLGGLLLAVVALLAAGVAQARREFVARGIPDRLPGPIAHGGVRPGLNVYLDPNDDEALTTTLVDIRATGVNVVKQPFYFQPDFDWAASDRLVAAVDEAGLTLVALLDGNPADQFAPPDDPAVFARWAGLFAGRYAERLAYYVIWDEPNLASHWGNQSVSPTGYAALLAWTAQAVRAADPEAVIVAAPLAPTSEIGTRNMADPVYLQAMYDAGAGPYFDVAAGKPYGFNSSPDDRTVTLDHLNFSRIILLREVMEANGDGARALWAGNWGWNSLPAGWQGPASIWGQADEASQARWTIAGLERARREWPWMGVMFLENWQPAAGPDDPRWGFSVAGRATAAALAEQWSEGALAYPGFHAARADNAAQEYEGAWRFSADFGADIGQSGDRVTFRFWGSEVGVRVRRADYHGRFYVLVDGRPARGLPADERGPALVLTSASPDEDSLSTEPIASGLPPGEHTVTLIAEEGGNRWALSGFSAGYRPPEQAGAAMAGLALLAAGGGFAALNFGRLAGWGSAAAALERAAERLGRRGQATLTALVAALVALTGWLTWGEQAAGLYRRLGDGPQLLLTAAAATAFYVAPSFVAYLAALALLLLLLYLRPAWGLALVALALPFYVRPKPMLGYRFSPVEIFLLVTLAAYTLQRLTRWRARSATLTLPDRRADMPLRWVAADFAALALAAVATISLLFTERLDVATNEWRVVVVEPALFYALLRVTRPERREMWTLLDAFVLGAVAVAVVGLWQYVTWRTDLLITSEGGLMRLRSVYGSPNNVALYLGRVLPLTLAVTLMGQGWRGLAYGAALALIAVAIVLSFSKGALFLGLPVALLVVLVYWRRAAGKPVWSWLVGAVAVGLAVYVVALQVPQLAGRLDLRGATGVLRLNLWQASLNMFRDHPIIGVGLDNFLYAYRGRYLFDAAWQEPNLSHPHNVILDFATRLGVLGLISGAWLFGSFWWTARRLPAIVEREWRPVAIGLLAGFGHMVAHGLVDHAFFLVDLAFAFFLMLGAAVWLQESARGHGSEDRADGA